MPAPTPVPNDYTQPAIPSSSLRWSFCSVDLQILTKSDGWNQGGVERALEYSQISSLTHANYVALAVPYDNLTKYTNYVTDARAAGFKIYHRSHWNAWQGDNGVGNIATSTSLTRSGSTATCVTGTAHGLATGDTVSMNGMNETEYRGEFTVTVVNSTTFTYPISGTPTTPATGNIGWRFGRQTYLDHTYDFIVANPTLFQAGDMFALCVEAQEADAQSMTFKTPGTTTFDYSLYNQFLIDQVRYANWAFQHISGLEGKIHTWPISFGLSNLNLNGQTINVGGSVSTGNSNGLGNADIATYFANRLTIDHYIDSTVSDAVTYGTDYNNDLNAIATAFPCISSAGGGLMIGEWGFHTQTDYGDQVQFDAYTQVSQKLESKSYVLGVNFWNHLGQTQSSLWTDTSGTIVLGGRQAVGAVNTAFHSTAMPTLQMDLAVPTNYHIFYYVWYGSLAIDGAWRHWNNFGYNPANNDIDSDYFPVEGPYSSNDPAVLAQHMQWIKQAGIGVVVIAWWGQGSYEDLAVAGVLTAANNQGLKVAFLIDDYPDRTVNSILSDIAYIYSHYGSSPAFYKTIKSNKWGTSTSLRGVFYIYNSLAFSDASWITALDGLRGGANDGIFLAQTTDASKIDAGHWDGEFPYDAYANDGSTWATVGTALKNNNALWSAGVGPGFLDIRDHEGLTRSRNNGAAYDSMFQYALASQPTFISITSFNEWHEGSMIEPAQAQQVGGGGYTYFDFANAYGLTGVSAQTAYINRTRYWTTSYNRKLIKAGLSLDLSLII